MLAQEVDRLPDVGVLGDGDDVVGVDLVDGERVEVFEDGLEDRVFGDDPPELARLEDGGDLRAALDEDARHFPDVVGAFDLRARLHDGAGFGVVLDVRLHQLFLGDHALVLAVVGHEKSFGVLPLEP